MMRSPPPKRRPVADRDQHRVERQLLAVEVEGVVQRLEDAQLGQGREVVAHLALGPGHPVGALVDHRVEAGRQHGREVLAAAPGQVDLSWSCPLITASAAATGSLRGRSK